MGLVLDHRVRAQVFAIRHFRRVPQTPIQLSLIEFDLAVSIFSWSSLCLDGKAEFFRLGWETLWDGVGLAAFVVEERSGGLGSWFET